MSDDRFDVLVLGGGSGGYSAAIRAAELGKSVGLIERDAVGGTCLHRGCVPTKAMLHAAETVDAVRTAGSLGVSAELTGLDMTRLSAFREGIVAKKHKGLQGLLSARGITTIVGEGVLADGGVLVDGELYRADDIVLATGARSRSLPGLSIGGRVLTSEEALSLPKVPGRVIVLGGGVIGVEFASMWRSFGAEVTVIEALPRLLPGSDESLGAGMERAFRRRGITSVLGTPVKEAGQSGDQVSVLLEDGSRHEADYLLVAIGRVPATDGIGLDEAGITRDRGFVVTDEDLRTSVPGVWAVGDIVAGPQLAHRGFQHGIAVAERIAGLTPPAVPDELVPRITYSDPETASVGVAEAEAVERFGRDGVVVFDYNLAGNARSEILGTSGFAKVIRRVDGPVIGVHLLGARVGELIAQAQLAIGWEAHPEDIAPFIQPHPTQSEALGEAYLALAGRPLHTL